MDTIAIDHTDLTKRPPLTARRVIVLFVALVAIAATLTSTAQADDASAATEYRPLVGTWLFDVPETEEGTPAFQSLMTFHKGGTLTEVSAELALGLQGPAQGVWEKRNKRYIATFQTWVFNGDPMSATRMKLRAP